MGVTAGHELVGSIVAYLTMLSGLPPKLTPGATVPDVQTFEQALIIIALTGVKMPKMVDSWTHLLKVEAWPPEKQQGAMDAEHKFQADLRKCSDAIQNKNHVRERRGDKKCTIFDPRILESSVSI